MTDDGTLMSPFVLEYTYKRSLGPVLSRYFTALRDRRVEGVRTAAGSVLVPPQEYDPATGAAVGEPVEVGPEGVVQLFTWVSTPNPGHPLQHPFAFALILLDGADTAMLHAVDAPEASLCEGLRVRPRWREERGRGPLDIHCFEVVP